MQTSPSLEFQNRAPRTSVTGAPQPPLTKLVLLDPKGPRTRAAPHANLEASAYHLAQAWSSAGSPQDMSPRGHQQILPRRVVGTILLSRPEEASPYCSLVASRRLSFCSGVQNTSVPEMFLQHLTDGKQASSSLTAQHRLGDIKAGMPP